MAHERTQAIAIFDGGGEELFDGVLVGEADRTAKRVRHQIARQDAHQLVAVFHQALAQLRVIGERAFAIRHHAGGDERERLRAVLGAHLIAQQADWIEAFHREALLARDVRQDIGAMVDRFIHDPGRWTYLWEVDGRAVSLVCAGAATPNGIRIGPVYTPPGHRRTGYAGALTAAASQDQLDRGRRFCFLFTDLANKTSNHIYQAVGYEPVTDIDRYRLERPAR